MTDDPAQHQPAPAKPPKAQIDLTVVQRLELSPSMVRIVASIGDPSSFRDIEPPEKYCKLVFFDPELGLGDHPDYWSLRETLPREHLPVTRHMTLRHVDLEAGQLWIDVALHGDSGWAGPWAAGAQPGDTIVAVGPGGKWIPDPQASWSLMLGDEAAIPAVLANVEAMPEDARGEILLEVQDADHHLDIQVPSGWSLRWIHRAEAPAGFPALVEAARTAQWPGTTDGIQVFAHGEREAMKALRPVLFEEHGLDRAQVSLSGYWARGRDEDAFQAEKKTPVGKV
ncbi:MULTISPECIES: siderophore-interacting protein [Kocuria]|uniref:siderophore-interacting protein n=1 Tax=Kocuria TaxID=57493 RepID=UPI0006AA39BD|nr:MULTISPECIES: siderophore-interacting protein [Kocuria]ALB04199.1 siderophore-interacting protein [Kocuria palustris]MBM7823527.1 NADPH-dependent ferric siderophore reductase [Kocuria palustris]MCM3332107.1 siderophore-interacting protein [Kocuria palustris]MCY1682852.1 siderophore-interacting protein [Kocuria sp. SL71]PZO70897.1 MAG: siderophore-interacting protein [Kocuria palustris]